jgi:hypothetical protein
MNEEMQMMTYIVCFVGVESFEIHNLSRKYFKGKESCCKMKEVIMSCK